ncbi:RHS repeat domain-containing protein [Salinivibrio sp. ML290]|uniref:RHS repeat domain-containing protein n=1 Tax=Salinivibrio sp. ML290 TaxID=1909468 RepID=UPI0009885F76|nr:RHS repeat-associated core domain-containing protein [Salinivibrio sp. ML290]
MGDTQTHYLWDGAHIVQQQQATADGQVLQQTEYLYEPGSSRPMAQVTHHEQGSELHYIVTDHAGTPQELCNEQGDIVWRGEQALWGHYHGQSQRHWQRREEAANDSIQCDLRYQGQLEDAESGLYYNVNRYYDADSGQYLSPDPIGFAGGLRPQAYVANPLEWVDPLGLAGCGSKDTGETTKLSKSQGINELDPNSVRFSQNSVNGAGGLTESMNTNGWKGDPIDVVKMDDGGLTTIDNTRVLAASRAKVNVQAKIHGFNEPLPEDMIERFTTKKGVPSTWGEAIKLRIGKQSAGFRNKYPNGSPFIGSMD